MGKIYEKIKHIYNYMKTSMDYWEKEFKDSNDPNSEIIKLEGVELSKILELLENQETYTSQLLTLQKIRMKYLNRSKNIKLISDFLYHNGKL